MKIKQAILAGSLTLLSLYYTSLQCFAEDETQDETLEFLPSPYAWLDYANETKTVLDTLGLSEFSIEGWAVAAVAGLSFSAFSYLADYYSDLTQPFYSDVLTVYVTAYCANSSSSSGHTSYSSYATKSFTVKPPFRSYRNFSVTTAGSYGGYYLELQSSNRVLGSLSVSWVNKSGQNFSANFDYSPSDIDFYSHSAFDLSVYVSSDINIPFVDSPPTDIPPHSIYFFVPPNITIPSVTLHAGDTPEFILSDIVDNVQKSVPSADLSEITEQIEGIIGASSGDYYDLPAPLFPNPGDQQLLPTMETVDESNATFSSALDGTLWWFQNFKSMFESDFFKQFLPFIILSLIFAVAYLILRW